MDNTPSDGESRHLQKGSVIYPVPYHGAKELGTGLEKKMRKEMGLKNR